MSTLSSRTQIMNRLRISKPGQTADAKDAALLMRKIEQHYQQPNENENSDTAVLAEQMAAALRAAHAEVLFSNGCNWPNQLAEKIRAEGIRNVLLDFYSAEGRALRAALPPEIDCMSFQAPLEHWKQELFDTVAAGFTVARSGIAQTGTLIIEPDSGTPRTVSLVPPLHIALLYRHTLHADLFSAARNESWSSGMPSNLILVSGPSKTSDIQQTLAYGAHGPRKLWVVIVDTTAEDVI
jgi:L-lactate dehydrogenase complex protein LldG